MDEPLWLSLGENCLPDDILRRHGLKSFSTPFSSGRTNISYVLEAERSGFDGLLDAKHLRRKEVAGHPVVVSNIYGEPPRIFDPSVSSGFEFTHHDVIADQQAIASCHRKIDRWQQAKTDKRHAKFLYFHRRVSASNMSALKQLLIEFCDLYAANGGTCEICAFHQTLSASERRLDIKRDGSLLFVNFITPTVWAGANLDVFWARCDDDLIVQMLDEWRRP